MLLSVGCSCDEYYNTTGAHQDAAEANAKVWAAEMKLDNPAILCNKHDTDGDGYVSCSVNDHGKLTQVECAGEAFIFPNTGCRAPKIKMPVLP